MASSLDSQSFPLMYCPKFYQLHVIFSSTNWLLEEAAVCHQEKSAGCVNVSEVFVVFRSMSCTFPWVNPKVRLSWCPTEEQLPYPHHSSNLIDLGHLYLILLPCGIKITRSSLVSLQSRWKRIYSPMRWQSVHVLNGQRDLQRSYNLHRTCFFFIYRCVQ